MAAAVDLRHQAHPRPFLPHVQGPDAFRSVDLVGGEGHQVDLERFDIHRDLADALRRVAVEENALFLGDPGDLGNRMNRPDFVVGQHDGDEDRLVRDGFPDLVGIDEAFFTDRQVRDLDAALLQRLAGVQHRPVLRATGNDVVAFLLVHFHDALERQVVGFRGPAREDDFLGIAVNEFGDLLAGVLDRFFGFPSELMVAARGVAEFLNEVGQHCLKDSGVHRGRGVIVHKNRELHRNRSFSYLLSFTFADRRLEIAGQWWPNRIPSCPRSTCCRGGHRCCFGCCGGACGYCSAASAYSWNPRCGSIR